MNSSNIRKVLILAVIAFATLISTQVLWYQNAQNLSQKRLQDKVFLALNDVAKDITVYGPDSLSTYEPVKQLGGNYFVVQLNDTLHPYLLENLLKERFAEKNIENKFEYAIYDCFNNSTVFARSVDINSPNSKDETTNLQNIDWKPDGHYFGVYIDTQEGSLDDIFPYWRVGLIISLVIMLFFVYTLFVLFKEKRLSEMRTDFLRYISHELKTPITTLKLTSDLLNKKVPEDAKRYTAIIQAETSRLRELIQTIVRLGATEKNLFKAAPEAVNLNKICLSAIEKSTIEIDKTIHLNFPKHLELSANFFQLENVFLNLIENAKKHSGKSIDDLQIIIEAKAQGKYMRVLFMDNGKGLDRKLRKNIFKAYYRGQKSSLTTEGFSGHDGFGLGLFYTKKIIRNMGGTIEALEATSGATFELRLPL